MHESAYNGGRSHLRGQRRFSDGLSKWTQMILTGEREHK
jgi:hypothetical protein